MRGSAEEEPRKEGGWERCGAEPGGTGAVRTGPGSAAGGRGTASRVPAAAAVHEQPLAEAGADGA